jgi:electron transfer flavoprotein beta subunit
VPKTDNVQFDWKQGKLIRDKIENMINPDDIHAIEVALQLRDKYEGTITAITMGPPQAEEILREAFALGVDDCVLITDPAFAGSDTLITTRVLERAIRTLGQFDVLLMGFESIDGSTAQVSYQLAEAFNIPHITQHHSITFDPSNNTMLIDRIFGHEFQKIRVSPPLLIATKRNANTVRFPSLKDIKYCFEKPIQKMTIAEIGGKPAEYGLQGSPTITIEGEVVSHTRKHEVLSGSIEEKVENLVQRLKKYEILRM